MHEHVATDRRVRALVREQLLQLVNESFSGAAFVAEDDGADGGVGDGSSSDARADAAREELGDAPVPGEGAASTSFASLLSAFMYSEGFSDWAERAGLPGLQKLAESKGSGPKFKWGRGGDDDGDDGDDGDVGEVPADPDEPGGVTGR